MTHCKPYLMVTSLFFLSFSIPSKYTDIPREKQAVRSKVLSRCASNASCSEYLTDTSSLVNLVKYENQWIRQVYPQNQLYLEGLPYLIGTDIRPLRKSYLKQVTFIPNTVNGYELIVKNKKYILLAGNMLNAATVSGGQTLVIVFDLQQKWKGRYRAYGLMLKNFSIRQVGDHNKDGIPDIIIGTERQPLIMP